MTLVASVAFAALAVGAALGSVVAPYAIGAFAVAATGLAGSILRHPPGRRIQTAPRPSRPRRDARASTRIQAVVHAGEQLRVVFQPIVDLRSGAVAGYEALARFPTGRPDEWFAEAHAVGLGVDFEMSAIVQSVALRHPDWGYVSINVSPTTIVSPAFAELIARMTEPDRLVVELTEHALVEDYERLRAVLVRLRNLGIKIAVDDAGSGISSFRHIVTIAPEIVKLDRSLISRLESDSARRALGEALVHFATRIGAVLVAEGIERDEERAACLELGINFGQGYLLGRPAPRHDPGSGQ
ncbi:MAG: EAL domain-containing protein [Acidobacteria bacterium]|nr:EAL domain-containing protein [Acidobacteriota bacterium]